MKYGKIVSRVVAVCIGSGGASAALAGGASPTVTVGPLGAASSIPTMSNSLLIALGLLLAVVAVRAFRQHAGTAKMFCIALFGGGVVLGGLGIDRTLATSASVPVASSACDGGTDNVPTQRSPFDPTGQLTNDCPITLQIKAYNGLPCPPSVQIKADGDVGATIPPGGTVTLNSCPGPT